MLIALLHIGIAAASTFETPNGVGVKWRYWVQDGGVSEMQLSSDIGSMASVGSGGLELLAYQSYGFPVPTDISQTGYGSDAFKNTVQLAAQYASVNGLTLDLATGPSQGAGIPSRNPDADGYNTELAFGYQFISANTTFSGSLPDPIVIPLAKYGGAFAPVFNVTTHTLQAVILSSLAAGSNFTDSLVYLRFDSAQDVTSSVQNNSISLPLTTADSVLIAFYSRRNGYQEAYPGFLGPQDNLPASWGCYIVDHFSAEGANLMDNFTQQYLGSPLLSQLSLIWEDSMEFRSQLYWTKSLLARFLDNQGYSAVLALPSFYSPQKAPFQGQNLPPKLFQYSDSDLNSRFWFDYSDTLTLLYMEYVSTRNSSAQAQGLRLSLQPGYGFMLDVAAAAGMVAVPEIESLAFTTVDNCRQASGGVHLSGAKVFSTELGAQVTKAYQQEISEIIALCNMQFAGTVNQVVIHGFPYNGQVALTTWPGLTTFSFVYSEMHGPRQPAWTDYTGYMRYLARSQYILQKGSSAKMDLAVYRHDFNVQQADVFGSNVLQVAGFTYDYVSPHNFNLSLAFVSNNRLGESGPSYRALILNNQSTLTVNAASAILKFAQAGLPVVILGQAPSDVPGFDPSGSKRAQVVASVSTLLGLNNVKQVSDYSGLMSALAALQVTPSASLVSNTNPNVYSVRRTEASGTATIDYYWFYNAGTDPADLNIKLETTGANATPFQLNAWSGQIAVVKSFSRVSSKSLSISGLHLAGGEVAIFALTTASSFEGVSASASSEGMLASNFSSTMASINLSGWSLQFTSWDPPSNLTNYTSVLTTVGPIHFTGVNLTSWNSLTELQGHTGGRGIYSTSFEFNFDPSSVGAVLDFSGVSNGLSHTVVAAVNGQALPTLDFSTKKMRIPSSVLKRGSNSITIQTASVLHNSLNLVDPTKILALGGDRLAGLPFIAPNTTNGLIGSIQVVPFPKKAYAASIAVFFWLQLLLLWCFLLNS